MFTLFESGYLLVFNFALIDYEYMIIYIYMHISYMWAGDMYGSRMKFPPLKPEAWWLVPIEMSSDQAWSLMIDLCWGFLRSLKLDDCFLVVSMVNDHARKKKPKGVWDGRKNGSKIVHFPSLSATTIICIICLLQFNEASKFANQMGY